MKCTKDNWEDVKKYFEGTFVKVPELGDTVLYVSKVTPDEITFTSSDSDVFSYTLEEPCQIGYLLPHKKTYQWGNRAALLTRRPARMWKKGLSEKNTSFYSLDESGTWIKRDTSIENYLGFVQKSKYVTYYDALLGIKDKTLISAALSTRVSINNKKILFVDDQVIGKVVPYKKTVVLNHILFATEVQDLFPTYKMRCSDAS